MKPSYEEVEHTADWALRVRGRDLAELCQVAAAAMLAACGARPAAGPVVDRSITLAADDRESLLVRWLEEILFNLDARRQVPIQTRVETESPLRLRFTWRESPLAAIEKPIKAVTYNDLRVAEAADGLEATIVFDV